MRPYSAFSEIYDRCMDNVPYDLWAARLNALLHEGGVFEGAIVVDIGCGTGEMTRRLFDAGFDMIGVDASREMLSIAQEKEYDRLESLYEDGDEVEDDPAFDTIRYIQQDARELELYGTAAAMVSVCDTMNYLTSEDDLLKVFRLVNNYLDRDGLFVFDLKTAYYYEHALGNRVRVEDYEDATMIWDNSFDAATGTNEYALTIFRTENGEDYRRSDEVHVQRAYSVETIRRLLEEAGMRFIAAYDGYSDRPATETSERLLIVAAEGFQENKYYEQ